MSPKKGNVKNVTEEDEVAEKIPELAEDAAVIDDTSIENETLNQTMIKMGEAVLHSGQHRGVGESSQDREAGREQGQGGDQARERGQP